MLNPWRRPTRRVTFARRHPHPETAMLGIIAGSSYLHEDPPADTEARIVATDRGDIRVHMGEHVVFLRRHGHDRYRPPHQVPHHAHALALERLGVSRAVGLASLGALRAGLEPGTAVVPDDYLSFHPPPTFADDERLHIVPGLDPALRRLLLEAAHSTDGPVHDGGVYVETRGPRFETRAEIRLLADYGDVIGMTAASEATLLQERGIAYAVIGLVDNLAHGVGAEPLTLEAYEARLEQNRGRARAIVDAVIRNAAS
jgi:5'-methylthioadenosine phosphorylase